MLHSAPPITAKLKYPVVGGSGSINSMVWFRGQQADFDDWGIDGWRWQDVESSFVAVENKIQPQTIPHPHPLAQNFASALNHTKHTDSGPAADPEIEGTGLFRANIR